MLLHGRHSLGGSASLVFGGISTHGSGRLSRAFSDAPPPPVMPEGGVPLTSRRAPHTPVSMARSLVTRSLFSSAEDRHSNGTAGDEPSLAPGAIVEPTTGAPSTDFTADRLLLGGSHTFLTERTATANSVVGDSTRPTNATASTAATASQSHLAHALALVSGVRLFEPALKADELLSVLKKPSGEILYLARSMSAVGVALLTTPSGRAHLRRELAREFSLETMGLLLETLALLELHARFVQMHPGATSASSADVGLFVAHAEVVVAQYVSPLSDTQVNLSAACASSLTNAVSMARAALSSSNTDAPIDTTFPAIQALLDALMVAARDAFSLVVRGAQFRWLQRNPWQFEAWAAEIVASAEDPAR